MNIQYKRDADSSFMIIEAKEEYTGYEKQILMSNDIDCLLPYYKVEDNNRIQYWYEITGLTSLKDYYMQQGLSVENLCKLLLYIKMAYDRIGYYLIDQGHVMLDPDTVYIQHRMDEYKLYLTYYPENSCDVQKQIENIFEYLLTIVNHNEDEITKLVYTLYEMNCRGVGINELVNEASQFTYNTCYGKESADEPVKTDVQKEYIAVPKDVKKKDHGNAIIDYIKKYVGGIIDKYIIQKYKELFPKKKEAVDFAYLPDYVTEEPTVLIRSDDNGIEGKLLYEGNLSEKDFFIRGETFSIGSSEQNDGVIAANTVSRFHGIIERDSQGSYFLSDLNSTNGTFLNGEPVAYKARCKLSQMDEIMFADVCYRIV